MSSDGAAAADAVIAAIRAHHFHYHNEDGLQAGLLTALERSGIAAEREVCLNAASRIDLLAGRIGIEVKVAGTTSAVARQLRRYCEHPDVDVLVLVTSVARHAELHGIEHAETPILVVSLLESAW
jgi:hypothetical protein